MHFSLLANVLGGLLITEFLGTDLSMADLAKTNLSSSCRLYANIFVVLLVIMALQRLHQTACDYST